MAPRIPARLTAAEGRKFALTVGAAFLVLAGLILWRGKDTTATVLGALGGVLIVAGLAIPTRLGPVQRAWMNGAHGISKVTTPIVLAGIYFIVIAPTGFMLRLFRWKSPGQPSGAPTYWVTRERTPRTPDHMQHQY